MKSKLNNLALVVFSFSLMGNSSRSFETILQEDVYEFYDIYPPEDLNINTYRHVELLANKLNLDPDTLYELIYFETAGTMNPRIQNPFSSAKGLIQFTDKSAANLKDSSGKKYKSSNDLIERCGTVDCQLAVPSYKNKCGGPVYQYLSKFRSLKTKHELYMAVFYPSAMNDKDFKFHESITNINPGIKTAKDYIQLAEQRMPKRIPHVD